MCCSGSSIVGKGGTTDLELVSEKNNNSFFFCGPSLVTYLYKCILNIVLCGTYKINFIELASTPIYVESQLHVLPNSTKQKICIFKKLKNNMYFPVS